MVAVTSVVFPAPSASNRRWDAYSDSEIDECWICLSSEPPGTLARVCDCPRVSHHECLARWQLTNYGRREENFCRFCNKRLPALWKPNNAIEAEKEELRVAPVMAVRYNGPEGSREFKLRVRPGPEGLATFKAHLKEILGFEVGPEFDVTFECQMPSTGSMMTLSGLSAYGAATHCAALLAANKASAQAPASPPSPAGTSGPAKVLAARSSSQQQRECAVQPQKHGSGVRPVPRLSEAPLTTAASSGAVPDMTRLPHGFRRACQSGYLPFSPSDVQQSDLAGAFSGGASPYSIPSATRARTMEPAMSRSFGVGSQRHSRRASAGSFRANGEDLALYEEAYDDLVPLRPPSRASAADEGGGIADRGDEWQMETWTTGAVRFGGRALPTGLSGLASAGGAAATVTAATTVTACSGVRSTTANLSRTRSALTDHDVRPGMVVASAGVQGGSAGSSGPVSDRSSDSVGLTSTGNFDSPAASLKDLRPLGPTMTAHIPVTTGEGIQEHKHRSYGARWVCGGFRRGSNDDRNETFAEDASGSDMRSSSRSRMRLPSGVREAARHTVEAVARALMFKK